VSAGPFTPAVSAAGWIAVSGQTGVDADNRLGNGVLAQTRQALVNLENRLRSHGAELADVVKVNVFLTSMHDYETMNAAYAEFFTENPRPAAALPSSRCPAAPASRSRPGPLEGRGAGRA
jgi:2-iminobutanoate/2-iminopropanoate deaminase